MDEIGDIGLVALDGSLPLAVQCTTTSNVISAPDAAPDYAVYDADGTSVYTGSLSATDIDSKTGFRTASLTVSAANGFASGERYTVRFEYEVSESPRYAKASFGVV